MFGNKFVQLIFFVTRYKSSGVSALASFNKKRTLLAVRKCMHKYMAVCAVPSTTMPCGSISLIGIDRAFISRPVMGLKSGAQVIRISLACSKMDVFNSIVVNSTKIRFYEETVPANFPFMDVTSSLYLNPYYYES